MYNLLSVVLKKRLDLAFKTSPEFRARIVEFPGLWMSGPDIAGLREDLRSVARRSVADGSLDYGVFSEREDVLARTIVTLVYRVSDGQPVAFNALPVMSLSLNGKPVEVLHLGLVMIDPAVRSQGLSWVLYGLTCFLLFLRNQLRPLWISNVTQVPAVAGMVAETFSDVFPAPTRGARRSLRQQLIATEIMAAHRHVFGVGPEADFDADRFVITNAYTGGSDNLKKTFDAAPKHRKPEYNDFCAAELDYARGDDLLQIGQLDLNAAQRYLLESVPRNALGRLAVASFVILVQRLVLPVLHWADSRRQWSILRPSKR
ncbi:hypothetical protein [Shinella sp.]|uniref:hypothetical protein n=1 Tax=Shinella sp. TaxID=1870904 RepID=UPI0029B3C8D3|nr:hypothetical protein [Shinella sp.]MDX3974663.1 hypothetical protein [Shinella sp.]